MPIEHIKSYQKRVEQALNHYMPDAESEPETLHQAMRYSVLAGGKRIRAVLVYAAGQVVGVGLERLDGPACAVEIIHAYSLIHDDLPAVDDDDLRRGKPSCHKAFDEATAILAGDALQALAFQILAEDESMAVDCSVRMQLISTLARAVGSTGMVAGQVLDLNAVGRQLQLSQLENMHLLKTGALIRACLRIGALVGVDADSQSIARLDRYGHCIGLAFQIRDDILDVVSDTETLGKTQGADIALNKPTYPALLQLNGARGHARRLCEEALESLLDFGSEAEPLRALAAFIVERDY